MDLSRKNAFEALFRVNFHVIRNYNLRVLADPDTAEEIAQVVFSRLWGMLCSRSDVWPSEALLMTIHRNFLRDTFRRNGHGRVFLSLDDTGNNGSVHQAPQLVDQKDPARCIEARQMLVHIRKRLPRDKRGRHLETFDAIIHDYQGGGLRIDGLGISRVALRQRMRRLKVACQEILDGESSLSIERN